MDESAVKRSLVRISHEILEKNNGSKNVVLVGIKTRGVPLARAISRSLAQIDGSDIPTGVLDITLYRDDLKNKTATPVVNATDISFSVEGKDVVLVDDVLYTGRTVRAAIDAIMQLGRPKTIQLAVLIDRGHRELPIRADYVGKNIPTSKHEIVSVNVEDTDGVNSVLLYDL
jgi:pyrimidine operon attenuation protein/uracil phosphoribosyltransferase